MSFFLTPQIAQGAVENTLPMIEAMMKRGITNRQHMHIVVMKPRATCPTGAAFEDSILYEHSIGDPSQWEYDYRGIAREKARVAWENDTITLWVQQVAPHMYVPGNTIHAGGVNLFGIVVACSGVQWYFDQASSWAIAAQCQALSIQAYLAWRQNHADADFLK